MRSHKNQIANTSPYSVKRKSLGHQTVLSTDELFLERRPPQPQAASVSCLKHHKCFTFHVSGAACQTWPPGLLTQGSPAGGKPDHCRRASLSACVSCFVPSCFITTHYCSHMCWLFILPFFLFFKRFLPPRPFLCFPSLSPHPDRRSNSPSTVASKWFHPLSPLSPANDVPRSIILWCWLPESAGACVCVRSRHWGSVCVCVCGWIDTKPPVSCAVSMLPCDQFTAFFKPLLSNDSAEDVISPTLLRHRQPRWHPTKHHSPFPSQKP